MATEATGASTAGETRPVIGITLGDPAGVGPEVIRSALDSGVLDTAFAYRVIGSTAEAVPGVPGDHTARAALEGLEEAVQLAAGGHIAAVVTGPIHKARMKAIGFEFPGQTEFFATRTETENFAMCLSGGALTVGLVTAHVPLAAVPGLLTIPEIVRVGRLLAAFVHTRTGRPAKVAVAGLNPHAGESGVLGREEIDLIEPATAELNRASDGAVFSGPYPPDTVFYRAAAGEFDAILCMYHDQGLIPLKLHAFDEGVNITLGLPYPRTSPDHGTAFDIAGKNIARPTSMIAAIQMAAQLLKGNCG